MATPPDPKKKLGFTGLQAEVRRRSSIVPSGIDFKSMHLGSDQMQTARPGPELKKQATVSLVAPREVIRKVPKKKSSLPPPTTSAAVGGVGARRRSTVINMDAAKDKMVRNCP